MVSSAAHFQAFDAPPSLPPDRLVMVAARLPSEWIQVGAQHLAVRFGVLAAVSQRDPVVQLKAIWKHRETSAGRTMRISQPHLEPSILQLPPRHATRRSRLCGLGLQSRKLRLKCSEPGHAAPQMKSPAVFGGAWFFGLSNIQPTGFILLVSPHLGNVWGQNSSAHSLGYRRRPK